jgi:hypothetical protein
MRFFVDSPITSLYSRFFKTAVFKIFISATAFGHFQYSTRILKNLVRFYKIWFGFYKIRSRFFIIGIRIIYNIQLRPLARTAAAPLPDIARRPKPDIAT